MTKNFECYLFGKRRNNYLLSVFTIEYNKCS